MNYEEAERRLRQTRHTWLVTGAAGFIGSHLVERLLGLGQNVIGLDNFATGYRANIEAAKEAAGENSGTFSFVEGDICDLETCERVSQEVDFVLHQAALGSVPRSIENPLRTNAANVTGFLNMLDAGRREGVRRFVYAASSSTYGDHEGLPKVEDEIGTPLSPYAVSKYVDELYAGVYGRVYGTETIGLRYFNVFGPRQDPKGAYAAVIPRWVDSLAAGEQGVIYGDGETSRDFTFVDNVVEINILAALAGDEAVNRIYNVAVGEQTSLNVLYSLIQERVARSGRDVSSLTPQYKDFRAGDLRHSLADITRAQSLLGYEGRHRTAEGLDKTVAWFLERGPEHA